ncbi:MAG: hypothetical protein ACE5E0_02455 [Terriglobia bacterium]
MGYAAVVVAIFALVLSMAARSTVPFGIGATIVAALLSVLAIRGGQRSLGILSLVIAGIVAVTAPLTLLRDLDKPVKKRTVREDVGDRAERGVGPLSEEADGALEAKAEGQVEFVTYGGETMLRVDCSAEDAAESVAIIDRALAMVESDPDAAKLILADIGDCTNNTEVMKKAKELAVPKKNVMSKGAIVGASAAEKIVIRSAAVYFGVNGQVSFFSDEEAAKKWLTE